VRRNRSLANVYAAFVVVKGEWCSVCCVPPLSSRFPIPAFPFGFMKSTPVLVLSRDALLAALLGALIETLGLVPAFANGDERPRDTLLRVRPRSILLDCTYDDACTDGFLGPARMMGTSVVLFGSRRSHAALSSLAAKYQLPHLLLPAEPETVLELLATAPH
jgi:hypothetical protein